MVAVDDWFGAVQDAFGDVVRSHRAGLVGLILHGHVHQNEFWKWPLGGDHFAPTFIGGSLTTTGIESNGGKGDCFIVELCVFDGNILK